MGVEPVCDTLSFISWCINIPEVAIVRWINCSTKRSSGCYENIPHTIMPSPPPPPAWTVNIRQVGSMVLRSSTIFVRFLSGDRIWSQDSLLFSYPCGHSPLTSLISKALQPAEVLLTECFSFASFCTVSCKLYKLLWAKIPDQQFLQYPIQPDWYLQPRCGQTHLDHFSSPF